MFKIRMLQELYNLSDDQAESVIQDRLSLMRLPGLSLSEKVPAAKDKPAKLAQKDRDARWTV
ncbi:transposase [Sinorhizobium meliloti]|uniref:transposase n=1 Tax=Rhizobium meliloti TaxID=382 RepID=UPI001F1EC2F6|nr:transposase [Sinorhizobium meliloti]WQO37537.1 transposase [Sinorhizobium meliloti]WQO78007.1 transposase [Sinorhizobium meliloti]